jgi:hypothetical protein
MTLIRFNSGDIVVRDEKLGVSTWTNNQNNLSSLFTSSLQNANSPTSSRAFFLEVFQTASTDSSAEVQLALSYGHKAGSGSQDFTNDVGSEGLSAARTIYGQYRQLIFGDETQNFTFGRHTPDDIYVININRSRYKQQLKLGTLNLQLSGAGVNSGVGQTTLHLTDDSITNPAGLGNSNLGPYYNIVSGSSGIASGSTAIQVGRSASYGHIYPNAGLIILNPDAFDPNGALFPSRNSNGNGGTDRNNEKLFRSISGGGSFILDSEETISSQFYFVRARNNEFNYSNNPTFSDDEGNVAFDSMINSPKTFITTVGLYNDANDLVAVAKISQPIAKDPTKEALIRVKLDY